VRAPRFWHRDRVRLVPALLSPFSLLTASATARRVARPGWRAPVPVLCCGNVTVGGSGKTTLALDLLRCLTERGAAPHALLRGYGGAARGPRRVQEDDDAAATGDEALLLARVAPTWIGADRAAAARAAIAAGAGALVLDDGLQNPTLRKDASLLVIDGGFGFGNGRVLPAGPLREPIAAGAARCLAAVLIGEDATGALDALPAMLPVLRARLEPGPATATLRGRRVLAFAGIGRPDKFFTTLREAGVELAAGVAFPDHHRFSAGELEALIRDAHRRDAMLATTAKDAVRLPRAVRDAVFVADVVLRWEKPKEIESLLDGVLSSS
jgi:tetraacyldisaccharide 4'-kinase